MRSVKTPNGQTIFGSNLTALRSDARAASWLHAHQQLGAIALSTNPTNGQTLTLTINSTAITINFVSAIGTTAGNVLIAGTAALTAINLLALLQNSNTTNTTQVALSAANQLLASYISWSLSGTTITPGSLNTTIASPLTTLSVSTTVTGGSYTANTLALYVEPGTCFVNGTEIVFAGGSTPTVTAPSANPRIDVLTIDSSGALAWTTGTENASPVAPTYPANKIPICELYNVTSETILVDNDNQASGKGYILKDVRPMVQNVFTPGAVTYDIVPDADGTRNLGSGSKQFGTLYAKSVLLNGVSVNAQLTTPLTAGESLTAGNPVCVLPASSTLPNYDNSLSDSFTSGSHTSSSFSIANHSNRILVCIISTTSNASPTVSSVSYGGNAMTSQGTGNDGGNHRGYVFVLYNPPTGSNTLSITMSTSVSVQYYLYSYYNCIQSGTLPTAFDTTPGLNAGTPTLSPTKNSSLILAAIYTGGTYTGLPNNTQNSGLAGDSGVLEPPVPTSVSVNSGSGGNSLTIITEIPAADQSLVKIYKTRTAIAITCNSYVGIVQASGSAGSSLTVATGGLDTNQSGLSPGIQYYLNDTAGTFGVSAGTVTRKAGIATSATSLLITNIW